MTQPLYPLEFDAHGQPLSTAQLDRLIGESKRIGATDFLFLAHGFRCATANATALYTALLTNLAPQLAAMTDRKFAIAGVYWPSQEFRESFGTTQSMRDKLAGLLPHHPDALGRAQSLIEATPHSCAAQDEFVASVLSVYDDGRDDPAEGMPLLHQQPGSALLAQLPSTQPAPSDKGGVESLPLVSPVLGRIDTFLNFMSWTAMKNLSGEVGANGLAASVIAAQRQLGNIRIHLAGHSLGGRLMSACCKVLGQQGATKIASLSLLEAAFSHFGFSPDAGWGQPGFFRNVIESRVMSGPVISTFSKQDAVVGTAYAVASRLAHDRLQAIGDAADPYGGIGHNGAQRTPESTTEPLHHAGQPYRLQSGVVNCLDGSGGLIAGHGDVTNTHVTYAIASAICAAN